jgi:hypothetical protein
MVFKPSATLRESAPPRPGAGDRAFRLFLFLAVVGCLWTTVIQPKLPALSHWVQNLIGA